MRPMSALRSIHVLGSHELGGADRFYIRLIEALTRAGHPCLAVLRPNSPVVPLLPPQIEQVHLPLASKWDILSRWRLTRLIAARDPDVVQTYMGRATRLTRLPKGSRALHVARLGAYYKIDGYYRHAHAWVGNTRDICDYMVRKGLPAERVFYIGNFVPAPRAVPPDELDALRAQLGLPADAQVVFALGRMVHKKGFDILLQAFARLPEHVAGRPLRLVIAGDGPEHAEWVQLGRSLGLQGRVRWAGWQNDTAPFYALADVFVCPSRREPLGNVILEAWRNRLPVLSTRNEGAGVLIEHGVNGLLTPLDDASALAEGLTQLLAMDRAQRARLAEAGHATLQRDHDEGAVLAAYLRLYTTLGPRG
jgi:L-malate glycosyltransferase